MSRPARMRDMAALEGVGTIAVSRVINGSAYVTAMLFARLSQEGTTPTAVKKVILPVELVVCDSCGTHAVPKR